MPLTILIAMTTGACLVVAVLASKGLYCEGVTPARIREDLCVQDKITRPGITRPCNGNSRNLLRLCSWCNEDTAFCSIRDGSVWFRYGEGYSIGMENRVPELPPGVKFLDFSRMRASFGSLPVYVIPINKPKYFINAKDITHLSLARRIFDFTDSLKLNGTFSLVKNLTCVSLNDLAPYKEGTEYYKWESNSVDKSTLVHFFEYVTGIPSLRELSAVCSKIPEIVSVRKSSLETLVLSSNPLNLNTDMSALCSYQNLTELYIDDCGIKTVSLNCSLHRLKKLDLSDNELSSFPPTCVHGKSLFPSLQFLNISGNQLMLNELKVFPACLPELKVLDLSGNKLTIGLNSVFFTENDPHPKQLRVLILDNMRIRIEQHRTQPHSSALSVSLSSLRKLSVTDNNIDFSTKQEIWDRENPFANCTNLEDLILDGNDFIKVDESRFSTLFGHLQQLKVLSMRRCQLEEFVPMSVLSFPNLTKLDLSENRILCIPDGAFDSLPNFRSLDLSSNQIRIVSEEAFSEETRQRLNSVSLVNNPLLCSCENLWLKHWMASSPGKFSSSTGNDHKCRMDDCRAVFIDELVMEQQACIFSKPVSIFIILTCSVLVCALVIVMLIFRFRWHIRLLLHETFRGRVDLRRLRLQANHFDYDVFVSYAAEDLPWVRQHLMPELEGNLDLKLCIHERDFIPGHNIVDNIVDCVESSKKIVMVFSKYFVRSQWCQFELTYCLSHVMEHDDALIVVCVDDVASRDMTSAMMAVMKTTTYIQWEDHEDAVESFWGRLKLALNEIFENVDQEL